MKTSAHAAVLAAVLAGSICAGNATAQSDAATLESAIKRSAASYVRGDYRDAAHVLERALGDAGGGAARSEMEANALGRLADLYIVQGRYRDGEQLMRRVLASDTEPVRAPLAAARDLMRLARALKAQARYAEAETALLRAGARLEPQFGVDHPLSADCLQLLGDIARLEGRHDDAARRFWRAYMVRSYLHGPDSSAVGETLAGLGAAYRAQGRDADANMLFARALSIAEKPARLDGSWGRLDDRELRELNPPEREAVAVRGQISVRTVGPRDLEHAQHYDHLAVLYRALDRRADAEVMLRRSLSIRERAFGPSHPEVAQTRSELAELGSTAATAEAIRGAAN